MTRKSRPWRSLFALCACIVLLLSACQSAQDKAYDDMVSAMKADASSAASLPSEVEDHQNYISYPELSPDQVKEVEPIEGDTLQGHLTIMQAFQKIGTTPLEVMAREFMTLHPGVTIDFDYGWVAAEGDEDTDQRELRWGSQARVELASGEGDYIIYDPPASMNIPGLAKNGIFIDMYQYWKNDPDFNREDYYEEVLSAFEVDGKLATVPLDFQYNVVYLNKAVMEKIGLELEPLSTVTTYDVLNWYEQAREIDPELQMIFTTYDKDVLFEYESTAQIDLENDTAAFNSPEFIDFLERTRNVKNDDPNLHRWYNRRWLPMYVDARLYYEDTGRHPMTMGIDDMALMLCQDVNISFALPYYSTVTEMYNWQQQPLGYLAGPYIFTDSKGQLGVTAYQQFAVPSTCSDPDLAWEFIKYCLEDRPSGWFDMGSEPPNQYTFRLALNKSMFLKCEHMVEEEPGRFSYPTREAPAPLDDERALAQMEDILSRHLVDTKQYYIDVQDYLDEFYVNELTTPEQAAEKIQGRAYIGLNE